MSGVATTTEAPETESGEPVAPTTRHSSSPVTPLGRTLDGEQLPRLRRRFTPPSYRSSTKWGWIAPLIVTLCAGILHFHNLDTPHDITFDETYYAKDAYSLLVKHYARSFVNDPATDE